MYSAEMSTSTCPSHPVATNRALRFHSQVPQRERGLAGQEGDGPYAMKRRSLSGVRRCLIAHDGFLPARQSARTKRRAVRPRRLEAGEFVSHVTAAHGPVELLNVW